MKHLQPSNIAELISEVERQIPLKSEIASIGGGLVVLSGEHLLAIIKGLPKEPYEGKNAGWAYGLGRCSQCDELTNDYRFLKPISDGKIVCLTCYPTPAPTDQVDETESSGV